MPFYATPIYIYDKKRAKYFTLVQYIARHKRFKFTSERFGTYKEDKFFLPKSKYKDVNLNALDN